MISFTQIKHIKKNVRESKSKKNKNKNPLQINVLESESIRNVYILVYNMFMGGFDWTL